MEEFPGIRAPAHGSVYESTVRAIVGQQVSIRAARQICSRLARSVAPVEETQNEILFFPRPGDLARLGDEHFPMPARRRETLRAVCHGTGEQGEHFDLSSLATFKGIGPWTVGMVAMRGFGDPDIFPMGDLGLVKAYAALGGDESLSKDRIDQWRPWRSYAANLLWRSLSL
jgi:AraC family transcriptional regulator of adaptative response / DNA-3-methyladenine glycosylase II